MRYTLHLNGEFAPFVDDATGETLEFPRKADAVLAAVDLTEEMAQAGRPEGFFAVALLCETDYGQVPCPLSIIPATEGVSCGRLQDQLLAQAMGQ